MIYLINPPNPPGHVSNKDMMGGLGQLYCSSGPKIPPIDLPIIAACLLEINQEVSVIDCLGSDIDEGTLPYHILATQNDTLCIRTSMPTYKFDIQVAENLKEVFRCTIIFWGPIVELKPDEFLVSEAIDGIVVGEAEVVLKDYSEQGLENTHGIITQKNRYAYDDGYKKALIEDINELPFPLWEKMPYKSYILGKPTFTNNEPCLPIVSSKGCPFACAYCPYPLVQGRRWRSRTAESVVNEIEYIAQEFQVRNILFRDPEFTMSRKRIMDICDLLIEHKTNINWRCETRVDTLDKDLVQKMKEAGCIGINIGIESYSEHVLKKVDRKPIDISYASEIIKFCHSININMFAFFIIGLPGQNKREIFKMIDFALSLPIEQIQFTCVTPYPKTKLEKWAMEKGYIYNYDLTKYSGQHPVMQNDKLSLRTIGNLHRFSTRVVYYRFKQIKSEIRSYSKIQKLFTYLKVIAFNYERWIRLKLYT